MNITATDGALIAQYQSYMEQGNTVQANEILAQIPQGTQKIIRATDVNKWTQAILALERFYISDIEPYIQQQQEDWQAIVDQFSYQGEWASSITYVKNNFVSYTSGGVTMLYIATGNPPTGTAPTNTTYWRPLTIRGQQGQSGTGLAYRESWDAGTQYNANDAVTYEGALWMALQANQNVEPGSNASYWQKIINLDATTYPIQDTEPPNISVGGLWFNTSDIPNFATDSWSAIATIAESGVASVYYNIGDVKTVTLSGIGDIDLEIVDFNHDYLEGNTSAATAGITLITKNLLYQDYQMNSNNINDGGFPNSRLYAILSGVIYNALPSDLRNVVKTIYKWYGSGNNTTNGQWFGSEIWIPLEYEMFGNTTFGPATEHSTGNARQYPVFTNNASRIKNLSNGAGDVQWYWLATPGTGGSSFVSVDSNGSVGLHNAVMPQGVAFGLCI